MSSARLRVAKGESGPDKDLSTSDDLGHVKGFRNIFECTRPINC